jgi:lipopolysaccharide transport system ATP-binding protein
MSWTIKAEGIGKKYHKGSSLASKNFKEVISQIFNRFSPDPSSHEENDFWALKDISFEINEGDRVGIIGRNGAGKSTLLKIISRITEPTCGRLEIMGKVSSLLEVGTGFHPELTGRENIFLNGSILGMKQSEIRMKLNKIIEFSEVGEFINMPVKHYSSGMYVRLAFSVAAHLDPYILVLDEVLAVGDAEFQKKCLKKVQEINEQGNTIIYVSHDHDTVKRLTNKALFLRKGEMVFWGDSAKAMEEYEKVAATQES